MNLKYYTTALTTLFLLSFSISNSDAQCLLTSVATTGGNTQVTTCPGDGESDVIKFKPSTWAAGYVWVITDANNIILDHFWGNKYNFENSAPGECRVWGVSNAGFVTVPTGENIHDGDFQSFCWEVSLNFVAINKVVPEGATVTLSNHETLTYLCPGDGVADVLTFINTSQAANNYAYIITDDNDVIVDYTSDSYDFDNFQLGTCRVYGLGYTDNLTITAGEDINAAEFTDGCYDLSDNFVTIIKDEPNGGTVSRPNGSTTAHICVGDGSPNVLGFTVSNASNLFFAYILTDVDDNFIEVEYNSHHDFENATAGECRVYGISYVGNFIIQPGQNIFSNDLTDNCFDLSDNFVSVRKSVPEGGSLSLDDGSTHIFTCPADGEADVLTFTTTSASSANYAYVITDETGEILALPSGDSFDFEGAAPGICRIYGISYIDVLYAQIGTDINIAILADDCWEVSDNYIEVVREMPNGGTINTTSGDQTIYSCFDGTADLVQFTTSGVSNSSTVYVITNDDDKVVNIISGGNDTFNFNNAQIGTYHVYSVAYTGDFILVEGQFLGDTDISDDCYDISPNFITVIRDVADAGTITSSSGFNTVYTCPGDGKADVISFENQGASLVQYAYLILDINFQVIDIAMGDSYDFEGLGEGVYAAFGVSYTGNLIVETGDDPFITPISDDCYAISENWVDIFHFYPDGGSLFTNTAASQVDICTGDGANDVIIFVATSAASIPYFYIITDENDNILSFSPVNIMNFESYDEGICKVYGISFTGNFTGTTGENIHNSLLSDDCFDISETYVEINKTAVDGGGVSTSLGENIVYLCPGDANPNVIDFTTTSTANNNYTYIITDHQLEITHILSDDFYDFDNEGIGISKVWGVSYSGNLLAQIGDQVNQVALSDGCYSLSFNSIEIVRDLPNGNLIASDQGDVVDICVSDGQEDEIGFLTGSFSFAPYTYIITDENGEILEVMNGPIQDFENFGGGICQVWGLSYTGNLTAQQGGNIGIDPLSDDCFELSNNFIEINKTEVDGSTIFSPSGSVVDICVGDGSPDFIGFFNNNNLSNNYRYLITDENGILINVIGFNLADFENYDPGTCHIYGLDMTGILAIFQGENIFNTPLSTECYELSSNFITINKSSPDGGSIATDDGETAVMISVNDGIPDIINFTNTGDNNPSFTYVITDDQNEIQGFITGNQHDFEGAAEGVCRVWGLGYSAQLTGNLVGQTITDANLSTGCFDLSDNFVEIIKDDPNNLITPGSSGIPVENINLSITSLSLAPNPVSDNLKVSFQSPDYEGISQVRIYNQVGQVLVSQDLETIKGLNELNVQVLNWANGTYYIMVTNDRSRIADVFVKQ